MSRHLVDPELLPVLEAFPEFTLTPEALPAVRASMGGLAAPLKSYARPDVFVEQLKVPGPVGAPEVPVLIYSPAHAANPPIFLHIHGGGYVFGGAELSGPGNVRTASELGCVVVSVDYRLAPETPAPGALEDCYATLQWVRNEAVKRGWDHRRIAVGGESAGGGLAASLAIAARDRKEVALCFQMLIYPMLDDRTTLARPANPYVGAYIWNEQSNVFGWRAHLGERLGGPDVSAYEAAARVPSFAGLPPAYISVGALDLFLEENLEYARGLLRAGVPTELHVYQGAYHGFELAAAAEVTVRAEAERRDALRRAFAAADPGARP